MDDSALRVVLVAAGVCALIGSLTAAENWLANAGALLSLLFGRWGSSWRSCCARRPPCKRHTTSWWRRLRSVTGSTDASNQQGHHEPRRDVGR